MPAFSTRCHGGENTQQGWLVNKSPGGWIYYKEVREGVKGESEFVVLSWLVLL
jgi:hypothetical protein